MMKKNATEILTRNSDRWEKFIEALGEALNADGCDARTLRLANGIMAAMADVDVPGSIEYFEAHGGYCDCEILMNVDHCDPHRKVI